MVEYEGRLWEIPEGREYLKALISYGSALHNLMGKSHDAIEKFKEALTLDPVDHTVRQSIILKFAAVVLIVLIWNCSGCTTAIIEVTP